MRILALTTCHNRREHTVRALRTLLNQELSSQHQMDVCLVNDGCTDGTAAAVRSAFPTVIVLTGSGSLFWAGGMRFAWDTYVRHERFDYLLVFNDDIELYDGALTTLLESASKLEREGCTAYALCGALRQSHAETPAYGVVVRSSRWHPLRFKKLPPTDYLQEGDTMNMNFALISSGAIRLVGFLAQDFAHGKADYDFGLRLRAAGGKVALAPGYVGECDTNPLSGTSAASNISFAERWRRLTSVKEQRPSERAIYYRRHAGPLWPLFWVAPYARILLQALVRGLTNRKAIRSQRHEASNHRKPSKS